MTYTVDVLLTNQETGREESASFDFEDVEASDLLEDLANLYEWVNVDG